MRQLGDVVGIFEKDGGFGVGVGDALAFVSSGCLYHSLWGHLASRDVSPVMGGLRYICVLAKSAPKIAAHRGYRKSRAPRIEMKQRFLLDGIDGLTDELPVRQGVEPALTVFTYLADTLFALGDEAAVGT